MGRGEGVELSEVFVSLLLKAVHGSPRFIQHGQHGRPVQYSTEAVQDGKCQCRTD